MVLAEKAKVAQAQTEAKQAKQEAAAASAKAEAAVEEAANSYIREEVTKHKSEEVKQNDIAVTAQANEVSKPPAQSYMHTSTHVPSVLILLAHLHSRPPRIG